MFYESIIRKCGSTLYVGLVWNTTNWTLCISSILATGSTKLLTSGEDDMSAQTPPK